VALIDARPIAFSARSQVDSHSGILSFWWLGQAGFAFQYRGKLILLDPYLSDSLARKYRGKEFDHQRMMVAPILPDQITGCDWYLCTHGHTDHMDHETIRGVLRASTPKFVVPRAEKDRARERGVPEETMHTVDAGDSISLSADEIDLVAIPAAHEDLELSDDGAHRYLGYVLSFGPIRVYHSGDTVPFPGLIEILRELQIDIALLPINGRDVFRRSRGVPGNMTVQEAVALCREARIPVFLGHHFEMFAFNTVSRNEVRQYLETNANGLQWLLPEVGVAYCVEKGDRP
jgi:L-ascorbate metabolism protein UlaG (beta-lactamase superfamily)